MIVPLFTPYEVMFPVLVDRTTGQFGFPIYKELALHFAPGVGQGSEVVRLHGPGGGDEWQWEYILFECMDNLMRSAMEETVVYTKFGIN